MFDVQTTKKIAYLNEENPLLMKRNVECYTMYTLAVAILFSILTKKVIKSNSRKATSTTFVFTFELQFETVRARLTCFFSTLF